MIHSFFTHYLKALGVLALAFAGFLGTAHAEIPSDYQPVGISPPIAFTERVFDLTEVFAKANKEKKPIFLYMGAKDCPYCKVYEQYLSANKDELMPVYSQFIVADLRTWLRGPDIKFKVGDSVMTYGEFMKKIDHPSNKLIYPSIWVISPSGSTYQWYRGTPPMNNTKGHVAQLENSLRRIKLDINSDSRF